MEKGNFTFVRRMFKKTIILLAAISILSLINPPQVDAYNCEDRNPDCPKSTYPTCYETTTCTYPNCAGTEYVDGVYKIYCSEPAPTAIPTPTPSGFTPATPTPFIECPVCPQNNHWNSAYSLCCKNGETPECATITPSTSENCDTGEMCNSGIGCVTARPTPASACGYSSFSGHEGCCYDPSRSQKYFCYEGSPDKQANGCICSYAIGLCDNQPKKCVECMNRGGIWTAVGCIPTNTLNDFVAWFLSKLIFVASGIAFLLMAFGALKIITSAGSPESIQAGKQLITSSLAGLIFIILSLFLLKLIGVDILQIPGFGG